MEDCLVQLADVCGILGACLVCYEPLLTGLFGGVLLDIFSSFGFDGLC